MSVCSMRIVCIILLDFLGANDLAADVNNQLYGKGLEFDVNRNGAVFSVDAVYLNVLARSRQMVCSVDNCLTGI